MKYFFNFHKAQTDPHYGDEYDPLDAVATVQVPAVREDRVPITDRIHSYIPLFSEIFRHKAKPVLWPY